MAALSVVSDASGFPERPSFNEPPYSLGNFETMATAIPRTERRPTFTLGYVVARNDRRNKAPHGGYLGGAEASYENHLGHPRLSGYFEQTAGGDLTLRKATESIGYSANVQFSPISQNSTKENVSLYLRNLPKRTYARSLFEAILIEGEITNPGEFDILAFTRISGNRTLHEYPMPSRSLSPIRTKPQRTYDEIGTENSIDGYDVPFVLDEIQLGKENSIVEERLLDLLNRFGIESGLYQRVVVKRLGPTPGDPVQVMVRTGGRSTNLIDVGYGVSQVLPILVRSIASDTRARLLLQQPEVHLHPKAQAALGSFFVKMTSEFNQHFVIETHSDQILDRTRQEVAAGKIAPELVQFLYFERGKNGSTVYPMELDEMGNILNAPRTYRQFFIDETMNLLGRGPK